jgi:hypothetical protein
MRVTRFRTVVALERTDSVLEALVSSTPTAP